jgi:hypothetical protein
MSGGEGGEGVVERQAGQMTRTDREDEWVEDGRFRVSRGNNGWVKDGRVEGKDG